MGMVILESLISSLLLSIVMYLVLGNYSRDIVAALNSIVDGKVSVLSVALIFFPIFLIISFSFSLGKLVATNGKK